MILLCFIIDLHLEMSVFMPVCQQDNSKLWMDFVKFSGNVHYETRNNWLNFGLITYELRIHRPTSGAIGNSSPVSESLQTAKLAQQPC